MFNVDNELNLTIFNILNDINNNIPIADIKSKFSDTKFDNAFEYCLNHQYLENVGKVQRNAKGTLRLPATNIQLTSKGLVFIRHFSQ